LDHLLSVVEPISVYQTADSRQSGQMPLRAGEALP
jgi:hypothetical protein